MKTSDQDECVLCCREIAIYAVGACDHPVCYECSARMRVLCETNECPICRSDMPIVICTLERQPFSNISRKYSLIDRKLQVVFQNADIQKAFQLLLENRCKICDEVFQTFSKLKDHVRRKHELQYCELCSENLKIFPFERKTYDRKELARHKRQGDPDDTSHRGHPICEFCDERYVDSDELFRHLRREHYFCHFCDADGKHQYYEDYDYLRVHFRKEHYLCEEGDCANERFTGAFRSEIDLKAHTAIHHSKNKSKAEARQARTLELEFTYAHHNRPSGNSSPRGNRYQHKRQNAEETNAKATKPVQQPEAAKERINTQSTLEFPYLSEDGEGSSSNINSVSLQSFGRNAVPQRPLSSVRSSEDFPELVSTTVSVTSELNDNQSRKYNLSIQRQNNVPARGPNVSIHLTQKNTQPKQEATNKNTKSSWNSKKNTTFEDEFPKLESKKVPVSFSVNTTVVNNTVQTKPAATPAVEVFTNPQGGTDQFIVIKSKPKKKKQQNKAAWADSKTTDNKDDAEENVASNSMLVSNNNFNLLGEETEDRYKKNLVRTNNIKTNYIEDSWQQKTVSFGKNDFPPLAAPEPLHRPPALNGPKKKAPPPGFNVNSSAMNNSTPLTISLSSIARQIVVPNTNKTEIPHSNFEYKKPHNFNVRNENLASKIKQLSVFDEFKSLSLQFRQDDITADTYYKKCLEILGKKDFADIFPELICLLPDINKQQQLFHIHKKHENNSGAVPKQKLSNNNLITCDLCYQVLTENDHSNHLLDHQTE